MPRKVTQQRATPAQATAQAAPRAIPGSTIDRSMPEQGNATTASVRTNFGIAADEIEALQGEVERIDTESATETTRVNTAIAAETTRTDTQFNTEQTRVNTQFTTEQSRVNTALDAKAMRAGDLSGTTASTIVSQIQGRPIANTAPGTGQVLAWGAGNQWEPTTAGAGLTDAPTDHKVYGRIDGGWQALRESTLAVYHTPGTYTYTAQIAGTYLLMCGGAGGGGHYTMSSPGVFNQAGGGSGAVAWRTATLAVGGTCAVTVGAGGSSGTSSTAGAASTIEPTDGTVITAGGGGAASTTASTMTAGVGGQWAMGQTAVANGSNGNPGRTATASSPTIWTIDGSAATLAAYGFSVSSGRGGYGAGPIPAGASGSALIVMVG